MPRELLGDLGQEHGSEIFYLNPRQDEKAGIVHDERKISLALRVAPADISVPWCGLPGGGAKAKQRNGLLLGEEEIAPLRAGQWFMPEIVVAVDVFIPQARVLLGLNALQSQRAQGMSRGANRRAGIGLRGDRDPRLLYHITKKVRLGRNNNRVLNGGC